MAAIRGHELAIRCREIFGFDDGLRTSTEQFGPVRSQVASELIQPVDEETVELDQDLLTRHDHIVTHMLRTAASRRQAAADSDRDQTLLPHRPTMVPTA